MTHPRTWDTNPYTNFGKSPLTHLTIEGLNRTYQYIKSEPQLIGELLFNTMYDPREHPAAPFISQQLRSYAEPSDGSVIQASILKDIGLLSEIDPDLEGNRRFIATKLGCYLSARFQWEGWRIDGPSHTVEANAGWAQRYNSLPETHSSNRTVCFQSGESRYYQTIEKVFWWIDGEPNDWDIGDAARKYREPVDPAQPYGYPVPKFLKLPSVPLFSRGRPDDRFPLILGTALVAAGGIGLIIGG